MQLKKAIALFMTVVLVVTGCSSKKQVPKVPSIKKSEQPKSEVLYEYDLALKGYDKGSLGLSFFHNFTDEIENDGKALQIGVIIFADGYLQKYKAGDSATYEYMTPIKVKAGVKKETKMQMEDIQLDDRKDHSIHVCGVLNPSPIKKLVDYNVNHSISQLGGINVIVNQNDHYTVQKQKQVGDTSYIAISDDDLKKMHTTLDNLNQNMAIKVLQDGKEVQDYIDPSKKIVVEAAGDYGLFNVYMFVDGKPYDPQNYYPIETKPGYFSVQTIALPTDLKNHKNFFLVFAPKEQKNYVQQSDKYMIRGD